MFGKRTMHLFSASISKQMSHLYLATGADTVSVTYFCIAVLLFLAAFSKHLNLNQLRLDQSSDQTKSLQKPLIYNNICFDLSDLCIIQFLISFIFCYYKITQTKWGHV